MNPQPHPPLAPRPSPLAPSPSRLLILGDSITAGIVELRGTDITTRATPCYVDLLRAALPHAEILTDAAAHRTTVQALKLIDSLLASILPTIVLIMLGGGDADMDWKRFVLSDGQVQRNRVPVGTFEKNLREIGRRVQAAGASAVLTDWPNHCFRIRGPYVSQITGRDVTAMLNAGGGQAESDRRLIPYQLALNNVARDLNAPVLRYADVLAARPPEQVLGIDGAHPSTAGHALLADTFLPTLRQLLPKPAVRASA